MTRCTKSCQMEQGFALNFVQPESNVSVSRGEPIESNNQEVQKACRPLETSRSSRRKENSFSELEVGLSLRSSGNTREKGGT